MDVLGGRPPPEFPEGKYFERFSLDGTTPTTPPSPPTDLFTTVISASKIDLTWIDTSGDETGFLIDRSTGGSYMTIATLAADKTAYSDSELLADTTYNYQVAAFNEAGSSAYTAPVSATTVPGDAPTSIEIGSVTVSTVSASKGFKFGQATIAVQDDVGNPVPGALVTGNFSGEIDENMIEDEADENGISVVTSSVRSDIKKVRNLHFCVTAITAPEGSGLTPYSDPDGSMACGSL